MRHSSPYVLKIPVGGGTADTVGAIPQPIPRVILGIGCRASTCVLTSASNDFDPPPAHFWGSLNFSDPNAPPLGLLQRMSLTTGEVTPVSDAGVFTFWTWVVVSPLTGDAVVQSMPPPATRLLLFQGVAK